MATNRDELATILTTPHPARPYFLLGGALCLYGLVRNSVGGLLLLATGGVVVSKGVEELRRLEALHGGHSHGVNAPSKA